MTKEADFTRRIQSCLSSAGGEGTVEALRELLTACEEDCGLPTEHDGDDEPVGASIDRPMSLTFGMLRRARAAVDRASLSPPKPETETASEPTTDAPVQDTWFTDRSLPVMAMSGDVESDRVIKLHFRRPVSDADRRALCDALNLYQRSLDPGFAETSSERKRLVEALEAIGEDDAEKAAKWHDRQAESSMGNLHCGSENWEYREAHRVADLHRLAARCIQFALRAALAQEPAR